MIQPNILLVEDESSIADTIVYAFATEGFQLDWVKLGVEAIDHITQSQVDLVILDIGLPDISGFEVCKIIRQSSQVPIVFLTARNEEIDRVVGLEIGADDYVTKPFSPRELVARVKAILKRCNIAANQQQQERMGNFSVDSAKAAVTYDEQQLSLTRYEYRILIMMLREPGVVFSREQMMQQIWGGPRPSLERSIDTHIKTLRAKLKKIDPESNPIKTHRGFGYSLCIEDNEN